jgi:hypothetical protein
VKSYRCPWEQTQLYILLNTVLLSMDKLLTKHMEVPISDTYKAKQGRIGS